MKRYTDEEITEAVKLHGGKDSAAKALKMDTRGPRPIKSEREAAIDAIRTFSGDKVIAEIARLMYDNGFRLK